MKKKKTLATYIYRRLLATPAAGGETGYPEMVGIMMYLLDWMDENNHQVKDIKDGEIRELRQSNGG